MGRNTFESIGKELPWRRNIVISSTKTYDEIEHYSNPDLAIATLDDELWKDDKVFIIWWASLYEYFLDDAEYIYMTHINKIYDGDTRFPKFEENYEKIQEEQHSNDLTFAVRRKKWTEQE